ncbi:MAG: carbon monoxide dehydrogenase subunit G [Pigmentiphaga sp.]|nr:carbon monoxide dehydrogenase subunit G [Pigmentiphaga sp.]
MEMEASRLIKADRQQVWQALNDPAMLQACIPGCESIEPLGDDRFKVAMVAAVGFIKARFVGELQLENKVENASYDLTFNGSGGPAGFGKGTASVKLSDEGADTRLSYVVKAQVGGKLAQVGARVIDGVAKKLAEEFFERLDARVSRPVDAAATPASEPGGAHVPAAHSPASAPAPKQGASKMWWGAAAVLVIVLIMLAIRD